MRDIPEDVKRFAIIGAVFVAALIISITAYLLAPLRADHRVLFFPTEATGVWRGELRKVPRMRGREAAVREMLKEMALGPIDLKLRRTVPRNTLIRSVLLRDGTLYVDLSEHAVFDAPTIGMTFADITEGIRKTIWYNHPRIQSIVISVNGVVAPVDGREDGDADRLGSDPVVPTMRPNVTSHFELPGPTQRGLTIAAG